MKNNEDVLKTIFRGIIAAAVLIGYFSIIFGQRINSAYYSGLALLPVLAIVELYVYGRLKEIRTLNYIKKQWGKPEKRKRNFKEISFLFKKISEENKTKFYIDDQTWNDLTMDDIYSLLDRTLSNSGEQALYNILRTPLFSAEDIDNRKELIKLFQTDANLREKLQVILYKLGRHKENTAASLLWGEIPRQSPLKVFYYLMSAFAVFSIVSVAFLGPQMGALLIFIAFVANGAIHAKLKNNIYGSVSSIGKLRELIIASKKLSEINEPLMSCYRDRLKNSAKLCAGIAKKTAAIGRIEGIDMLGDYVNILFLVQEISFFSVLDSIKKYREELKEMYLILGEIDALISVASYRDGLNAYVEPEFTQDRHGINIENMKHPLIESAVPNSMEISEGGIIITGSNMSGKSTFLRTFGVNALFSQTIITCLAESYRGSFLKVLTSISPSDNIMGGKSYYLGEAEALLRIIRSCEDNIPSLCIIDEIFRGTNPTERISAAAEILDYLSDHNALTVVATHDIELTDLVKNHYECYYFTEDVGEDGLIFDYKIRKGISNTRNAVKVLKFLGYPDEIVEMANKRAEHITNM